MNEATRWMFFFAAMGFCAAYAMWGNAPGTQATLTPLQMADLEAKKRPGMAAQPSILKFDPEHFDFGEVIMGESRKRTVRIQNPTNTPITVKDIRGSCGCTTITLPEKVVPAKGSVEATVQFTALASSKAKEYGVMAETDEGTNVKAHFKFHASPLSIFNFEPAVLMFQVEPNQRTEIVQTTRMSRSDGKPFTIHGVNIRNSRFKMKWEAEAGQAAYKLICTLDPRNIAAGIESFGILTDHPTHALAELRVSVSGSSSVASLTPIITGMWNAEKKTLNFNVPLNRFTPGTLEVSSVKDVHGRAVKYTLERRSSQMIQVSIQPDNPWDFFDGRRDGEFEIQTNVIDEPVRTMYMVPTPPTSR